MQEAEKKDQLEYARDAVLRLKKLVKNAKVWGDFEAINRETVNAILELEGLDDHPDKEKLQSQLEKIADEMREKISKK